MSLILQRLVLLIVDWYCTRATSCPGLSVISWRRLLIKKLDQPDSQLRLLVTAQHVRHEVGGRL